MYFSKTIVPYQYSFSKLNKNIGESLPQQSPVLIEVDAHFDDFLHQNVSLKSMMLFKDSSLNSLQTLIVHPLIILFLTKTPMVFTSLHEFTKSQNKKFFRKRFRSRFRHKVIIKFNSVFLKFMHRYHSNPRPFIF